MVANQARYGFILKMRQGVEADPLSGEILAANARAIQLLELRHELEKTWKKTKQVQTKYYDKRHRPNQYSVGELVWLPLKHLRITQPCRKLSYKYFGPFAILEKIGNQANRLDLPKKRYRSMHNVFRATLPERHHKGQNEHYDERGPDIIDGDET